MNLLLLDPSEIGPGGRVELVGRRAEHIARVLGARPGDRLRVGVVRGPSGGAEVTAVESGRAVLAIELEGPAPAAPPVSLIVALPRPKALSRLLQTAASFGVARIDLINAWRVDAAYFGAARLAPERLHGDLRLGCEQGATTWLPELAVHRLFVPFVESLPPPDATARLVAHPRASGFLEAAAPRAGGAALLAVGPEGGWVDSELQSFERAGFAAVRLGEPVLRSEIALAAALAQLALMRRL